MGTADGMDPIRCLDKESNFNYEYGNVNMPFDGKVNLVWVNVQFTCL
jgi:hypothetical protein